MAKLPSRSRVFFRKVPAERAIAARVDRVSQRFAAAKGRRIAIASVAFDEKLLSMQGMACMPRRHPSLPPRHCSGVRVDVVRVRDRQGIFDKSHPADPMSLLARKACHAEPTDAEFPMI